MQDRAVLSRYVVGHIQCLRLPKKISDQLFIFNI